MSEHSIPVKPGDILAGKYRVDRVLGAGGMGVVVAATHLALDERVALKFLLPEIARNQEAVARFLREARAAAKIRSEHVARVTDVGTLENGAPYLVMEYLDGQDLSSRLQRGGPLPLADAVDGVLQACEALAEAHAIGIVHRDLKPANLFLVHRADGTPCVKVIDFGISKAASTGDGGDQALTRTTGLMGSPLYMSPEQLQSARDVDVRADVWALGVILFELVAGTQPFVAETMPQLVLQIMTAPPRRLQDLRGDVPSGLAAAIEQALQKDRDARLPDVAALAVAIAPFGGGRAQDSALRIARVFEARGVRAPTAPRAPLPPPARTVQLTTGGIASITGESEDAAPPRLPRHSLAVPIAVAATLLLVALLGVGVATFGRSVGSQPSTAPAPTHETDGRWRRPGEVPPVKPAAEPVGTPSASSSASPRPITSAAASTSAAPAKPPVASPVAAPWPPKKKPPQPAPTSVEIE